VGFVIAKLLQNHAHNAESAQPNYTKALFNDILTDLSRLFPADIQKLANAAFEDTATLKTLPFIEYFKYISEDVFVYLMDRALVLTDGQRCIVAREGFIYYSCSEFMQGHC
jgi:hypothetical protein